jgi:hypothetical protein
MVKRAIRVIIAFFFVASAGLQFATFTFLLLRQQVTYYEYSVIVNRLEFGVSLLILIIAITIFVYCIKKSLRGLL